MLEPIEKFLLEHLELRLHPEKVFIKNFHQGVDFLGYVNFPHYKLMRAKTRKRIFRKMRQKIEIYKSGAITEATLNQTLQSYLGLLSHADAHKLAEDLKNRYWFELNN